MNHYYSKNQDSKLIINKISIDLLDNEFEITNSSGVFSSKKLDRGTELLIKSAILKDGEAVLDLGCGCGVVGVTIAKAYPNSQITMCDFNKRAIKMARINVKDQNLQNAKVKHSDKYSKIEGTFDTIILNPPQSAGKQVCFDMITGAKEFLNVGGLLQIVARHNKGGKVLSEKMNDVFGNVKDIAKKGGFRVYISSK
jgi:16S rRNA (guanine1207-N2)-methyltransferase